MAGIAWYNELAPRWNRAEAWDVLVMEIFCVSCVYIYVYIGRIGWILDGSHPQTTRKAT